MTAGNASGINDGAAAIVVMSEEKAKELGVTPMAEWVAGALAGVRPEVMGIGPVASTKKVLAKTGMKIEDFDIIEANEASPISCSGTPRTKTMNNGRRFTPPRAGCIITDSCSSPTTSTSRGGSMTIRPAS